MLVRLAAPLFRWLEQRPPLITLILAGCLLAGCGALDYLTGANVGLSIAYLLPICLVTWRLSRHAGLLAALLSIPIWGVSNTESLDRWNGLVLAWNAAVRLGIFVIVIDILGSLRDALTREQLAARTDGLTGLLNRRAFEEAIQLRLQRPVAAYLALAYLDLDNFKALNDQRGHATGDEALRAVAATLSAAAPDPALVARLGGDE
ncbi:MAG TPA: GGDEF domain-containing protein, partial [Herpetosiphonaceae bacterium]